MDFALLLCAVICFGVLALAEIISGVRTAYVPAGFLLPIGLLFMALPALIHAMP